MGGVIPHPEKLRGQTLPCGKPQLRLPVKAPPALTSNHLLSVPGQAAVNGLDVAALVLAFIQQELQLAGPLVVGAHSKLCTAEVSNKNPVAACRGIVGQEAMFTTNASRRKFVKLQTPLSDAPGALSAAQICLLGMHFPVVAGAGSGIQQSEAGEPLPTKQRALQRSSAIVREVVGPGPAAFPRHPVRGNWPGAEGVAETTFTGKSSCRVSV